jgi:hypothetical protein
MGIETVRIPAVIAIGIGATSLMDLWNLFLRRVFGIPSLDYCMLGRWISHMKEGTYKHVNISASPPRRFECALGWIAHYTIGVLLTLGLFVLTSGDWFVRPTPPLALLYGAVTAVFPLFIMQPALGLGIASSRTPNPMRARLKSLMTHSVFGVGLYVCALVANYALQLLA